MKEILFAVSMSVASFALAAGVPDSGLKTDKQKTLYALGTIVGSQVGQNLAGLSLSPAESKVVLMGLNDAVRGTTPKVDMQTYGPKVKEFAQSRQQVAAAKAAAGAEKEKAKAKDFIAAALKEKGAVQYPSGLVYIPIKEGTGPSPKPTDKVKVHYHGTFIDGKVFDSSVQRGQPAEFGLNQVIPCWTEGVAKMKVGGKAKLICPSSIAYGDQGSPPTIPGGATLVFEVQLLDIVK